jgi:hypothetical protein
MRERACQSPKHEPGCPCVDCKKDNCQKCPLITDDHFQPKSILKAWNLKDSSGNHQWLSKPCHREKDRDTALRAAVLKSQLKGETLSFSEHRRIFGEK